MFGDYVFSTTYSSLPALLPGQSHVLTGRWAVDNSGYITVGSNPTHYAGSRLYGFFVHVRI